MNTTEVDAVVIGSGPNGLAAAITLQRNGLQVLLIEGKDQIGGGLRTEELTLPGFKHDICSAIHPMAAVSPFFADLPLADYGLKYLYPEVDLAHPFDDGNCSVLVRSIKDTALQFGVDSQIYQKLLTSLLKKWPDLIGNVLSPLKFPSKSTFDYLKFGLTAIQPATWIGKRFSNQNLKGFWAGMAAHSIQPLDKMTTSAIALVLLANGHAKGWPVPVGGSQSIASSLANYFLALGGKIETGQFISSLRQLPSSKTILFDLGPQQIMKIAGHKFSSLYRHQLKRYTYGMGVFKVDWALDEQIPFTSEQCRLASALHLGNSFQEIVNSERDTYQGKSVDKPFVLLAQQSIIDKSRAPKGKHTAWAYCHVPNGSLKDMTLAIENQVERFAPGFKDRIIGRHTMNTLELEEYNQNYIGGDINAGNLNLMQLFTRPALRFSPYRTSAKGMYICSASSPPGPGVHGMSGFNSAQQALKDIFKIII